MSERRCEHGMPEYAHCWKCSDEREYWVAVPNPTLPGKFGLSKTKVNSATRKDGI